MALPWNMPSEVSVALYVAVLCAFSIYDVGVVERAYERLPRCYSSAAEPERAHCSLAVLRFDGSFQRPLAQWQSPKGRDSPRVDRVELARASFHLRVGGGVARVILRDACCLRPRGCAQYSPASDHIRAVGVAFAVA